MNNHISDVELAGKGVLIHLLWMTYELSEEKYSRRHTALHGVLCFMSSNAPEYDDIKFLFNYCEAKNHV